MRYVLCLLLALTLVVSPGCTAVMWKRVLDGPVTMTGPEGAVPACPIPADECHANHRGMLKHVVRNARGGDSGMARLAKYVAAIGLSPFTLAFDAVFLPVWLSAL